MDQFSQSVNNDPALLGNHVGSDVRFGRLVQEYVDLKKEELSGGREVDFGKLFDAIEKELSTRVGGELPAKSFSCFKLSKSKRFCIFFRFGYICFFNLTLQAGLKQHLRAENCVPPSLKLWRTGSNFI